MGLTVLLRSQPKASRSNGARHVPDLQSNVAQVSEKGPPERTGNRP
jgi:hypothetical protein